MTSAQTYPVNVGAYSQDFQKVSPELLNKFRVSVPNPQSVSVPTTMPEQSRNLQGTSSGSVPDPIMPHIMNNNAYNNISYSSTSSPLISSASTTVDSNQMEPPQVKNNSTSRDLQTRLVSSVTNPLPNKKDFTMPSMSANGTKMPGFSVKNNHLPKNVRKLMIPGMGGDPPGPQPVLAPIQFPGIINPDIYIQNTQAPPVIPQINPPPVKVDLKINGLQDFYKRTMKPPVIINSLHKHIVNSGTHMINDLANQ